MQTDPSHCTNQERLRAGFTAIEMMVVVSIIIVLVAMVVPTIGPAMKKGAVHDAASAIQRACSQARQLARSNTEPRGDVNNPLKWYGVAVVVPSEANKPAYAVVIYDDKMVTYSTANDESNQYPNGTPALDGSGAISGYKAAAKFPFSRNVMPVMDQTASSNPAYTFMTAGSAVGWFYQYRTGFVFRDPSPTTRTSAIDIGVPGSGKSPESLGVASLDRKYIVAIAVYKIGLMNAQDAN